MHMWIPRHVEPRLRRSARTRPVMVLTGARQTGKTSTLLRLFPRHGFVSLDLPTEAAVNREFVRGVLGKPPTVSGAIVSRAPNSFPLAGGLRVLAVSDL